LKLCFPWLSADFVHFNGKKEDKNAKLEKKWSLVFVILVFTGIAWVVTPANNEGHLYLQPGPPPLFRNIRWKKIRLTDFYFFIWA
jgi:hypothetical protein